MATYYVRPVNGLNTNDGLSFVNAVQTTAYALTLGTVLDKYIMVAEGAETLAGLVTLLYTPHIFGANSSGVIDGTKYEYISADNTGMFSTAFPFHFEHMTLTPAGGAPATPFEVTADSSHPYLVNLDKSVSTIGLISTTASFTLTGHLIKCAISNCTSWLIQGGDNKGFPLLSHSTITDCTTVSASVPQIFNLVKTTLVNTTVPATNNLGINATSCVFDNSTINLGDRVTSPSLLNLTDSVIKNNTGTAIVVQGGDNARILMDNVRAYNNVADISGGPSWFVATDYITQLVDGSVTFSGIVNGESLSSLEYTILDSDDLSAANILTQGAGETTDVSGDLVVPLTGLNITNGQQVFMAMTNVSVSGGAMAVGIIAVP